MAVIEFVHPDRFVAGTIGQPGAREFYLQVRDGHRVEAVAIEKPQVQLLAERVEELLDEVGADQDVVAARPDNDPLELPVDVMFQVGGMSAAWEPSRGIMALEFHDLEADLNPGADRTTLRIVVQPQVAREFVRRSLALVAAGRQPCPLCSEPLNPSGHICPRANGYRRQH